MYCRCLAECKAWRPRERGRDVPADIGHDGDSEELIAVGDYGWNPLNSSSSQVLP